MKLKRAKVINYSGFSPPKLAVIPVLRPHSFVVVEEMSVSGDRPKDFIRVYEFGKPGCRRANSKTWVPYLAKVGDKWYPAESLTEYLLNQIGEMAGMDMAQSKLYQVDTQIRFCSRYFLQPYEELIHGAQIYASFLFDEDFVREVEAKRMERDIFSFQFAEQAIRHYFGADAEGILKAFVKLLVFDALIGNNDRHFYNWGIIADMRGKNKPRFSPIFDTARGFFWNDAEEKLIRVSSDPKHLDAYVHGSQPKIGWDGESKLNHFRLVTLLLDKHPELILPAQTLFNPALPGQVAGLLRKEFGNLFPPQRVSLVQKCFELRFREISAIFSTHST